MSGKRKENRPVTRGPEALREAQRVFNEGARFQSAGRMDTAVTHYRAALALRPDHVEAHRNLGIILAARGRSDEAMAHFQRALTIRPNDSLTHNNLGSLFKSQGRFDEARAHYTRAIEINPALAVAHWNRAELMTFHSDDAALRELETLVARNDLPERDKAPAYFALAKAVEDTGDYRRAFEHLRKGNELQRGLIQYDDGRSAEFFRRVTEIFDRDLSARFEGEGYPSQVPVFVLGMPRSGSTLVEQILDSHPAIQSAGEIMSLDEAIEGVLNSVKPQAPYPECVPSLDGATLQRMGRAYLARLPEAEAGKTRIVNKLPWNFLAIGLIRIILPQAKIIHTLRDPVDTCMSCYSKLFSSGLGYTYDLTELGRYYRRYSALMDHWRSVLAPGSILDVSYEAVVDDLEGEARRLIEYCGLPWDDRCLQFQKGNRSVRTASSVQVRQPLFRSSLQRWRRYEQELGPLLRELGDLVPEDRRAGDQPA